jgi:hypothetical protein
MWLRKGAGKEMGRFVNPDNSAFQVTLSSEIYVDKTGLIEETNKVLGTTQGLICNSRPRRFGKSTTANMLVAYYSKGCDSEKMFSSMKIAEKEDFKKYLNKFDVIHIDIQWFLSNVQDADSVVDYITASVLEELVKMYPEQLLDENLTLSDALSRIKETTGHKFIIIIDEWDVLIRDQSTNKKAQEEYINFLRGLFKGVEPTKYIELAYLTGILPIKKQTTQSALNNFYEFTMLNPGRFAPYIGFTEDEVKQLCTRYGQEFDEVKRWYDGYILKEYHAYNPKAVVGVMLDGTFQSYWSQTSTFESIRPFINMDFDGLKTAIIEMMSGNAIKVKTTTFQNDMVSIKNRDDVLTLLIHLGYLAYDQKGKLAYIPNEEIRGEFVDAVEESKWTELRQFEQESEKLLEATLDMDEAAVADQIEKIHTEYASVITYHNENSLSSVLSIAYLSSMEYYFKPIRELPTGRGFADFVFIPKPEYVGDYPALAVELKWNQDVQTALSQIKEKKYPESLLQYTGNILLVGINYDKESKKHACVMEQYQK